jgi:putative spermidine/putrescine transport system ATP-binding protein
MSDRVAVFNEGRIEQVGTPAQVYEHPVSEFVAGFVGVSNVLERNGRRFTVRPEKVRILGDGEPEQGLHVEAGTVTDTSYVGQATRYEVALENGGRLLVVRQNLETSHDEARDLRGRHVRVGWREAQASLLDDAVTPPEEEPA